MRRALLLIALLALVHCSGRDDASGGSADASTPAQNGDSGDHAHAMDAAAVSSDAARPAQADGSTLPVLADRGKPGCGLDAAAFCATFDEPAKTHGRAGELDSAWWTASRNEGQLSTMRAMPIGMAQIPACRAGVPTNVWPDSDALICDPSADIASHHLLVAAAAQNYGQNSYRIRQPFDFANRTGKIVFDATVNKLSPLHGWVSLAITDDRMAAPGYAILGNDEGSIIPRDAIEVHFANWGDETRISARNVHVFRDYVDTVYQPEQLSSAPAFKPGKLNRYEFLISEHSVEVSVTPYSDDGITFGAPEFNFKVDAAIPFKRGFVQLTVHNHAMLKYTHPDTDTKQIDATVAQIDNVGFDGPVVARGREYEVPDALVAFNDPGLADPYNTQNLGYDIGYVLNVAADGAKQTLHVSDVDITNVVAARVAFSSWFDFSATELPPASFVWRARMNGHAWHERKLNNAELGFLSKGPTVLDPDGKALGDSHSQGRLALTIEIPKEELVTGDNTIELVTENIRPSYPPLASNVDLWLDTK